MIYHICAKSRWEDGKANGGYEADTLETEGFMHASTINQVVNVANAVFTGQSDLVFLVIDVAKITGDLKYETAGNGEDYPHLYGTLNLDAVISEIDYAADRDGVFALPDLSDFLRPLQ